MIRHHGALVYKPISLLLSTMVNQSNGSVPAEGPTLNTRFNPKPSTKVQTVGEETLPHTNFDLSLLTRWHRAPDWGGDNKQCTMQVAFTP